MRQMSPVHHKGEALQPYLFALPALSPLIPLLILHFSSLLSAYLMHLKWSAVGPKHLHVSQLGHGRMLLKARWLLPAHIDNICCKIWIPRLRCVERHIPPSQSTICRFIFAAGQSLPNRLRSLHFESRVRSRYCR
jgi:hypothetical protein